MIFHDATKRKLTYGSVAEAASKLPVPQVVSLRDPKQYRIVGKPMKRLDTPDKVNGRAEFGMDVRRPGMLYAVVLRCPVFGGKVASFDATKAKAVPGVKNVIEISQGIAVVADNTWTAMQGKRALDVKWDEGRERRHYRAKPSANFLPIGQRSRAWRHARKATPRRRFPARRINSKRCTRFPTWRMQRWSR